MIKLISIALGGALGALLRYFVSGFTHRFVSGDFPWGTMTVNLIGSLVMGFLWGLFDTISVSQNIKLFLFIGLLGSFTTFSTFSLENFHMIRGGEYWLVFYNVALSVILGLAFVFAGFFSSRALVEVFK